MRKLINMLKKNDNAYSVGRICAVIGFIVWVLVTLWLAFFAKTWGNYESCTDRKSTRLNSSHKH